MPLKHMKVQNMVLFIEIMWNANPNDMLNNSEILHKSMQAYIVTHVTEK